MLYVLVFSLSAQDPQIRPEHHLKRDRGSNHLADFLSTGGFAAIFAYVLTLLKGKGGLNGWSWIFIIGKSSPLAGDRYTGKVQYPSTLHV